MSPQRKKKKKKQIFTPYVRFRLSGRLLNRFKWPFHHASDRSVNETLFKATKDPHSGGVRIVLHEVSWSFTRHQKIDAWIATSNNNPKAWIRSYTVSAYLQPNLTRLNLIVEFQHIWFMLINSSILQAATETLVSRALFTDIDGQDLTAYGVEFIHNGHL